MAFQVKIPKESFSFLKQSSYKTFNTFKNKLVKKELFPFKANNIPKKNIQGGIIMFIPQPFDEFLDVTYERITETSIKVTLPIKPTFANSSGYIHGGIISILADSALRNAVSPDENGRQKAAAIDLNVTFLKKSKSELLIARAFAVKEGANLTHADCIIHDDHDHVIAKAKAILFNQ